MKTLIFVLAALMITSSPVHAQVRINGGADVGASFVINPDRVTSEQVNERQYKWTPNLLNYPVTNWCVTKDGTAFKTIKKVRACMRVSVSDRNPNGVLCRDSNLMLEKARAIPTCASLSPTGECLSVVWTPAPESFEVMLMEEVAGLESQFVMVSSQPYSLVNCK